MYCNKRVPQQILPIPTCVSNAGQSTEFQVSLGGVGSYRCSRCGLLCIGEGRVDGLGCHTPLLHLLVQFLLPLELTARHECEIPFSEKAEPDWLFMKDAPKRQLNASDFNACGEYDKSSSPSTTRLANQDIQPWQNPESLTTIASPRLREAILHRLPSLMEEASFQSCLYDVVVWSMRS